MRAATYVYLGVNPFHLISEFSFKQLFESNVLFLLFRLAFQAGYKICLLDQEALSTLQTRLVIRVTSHLGGGKGSSTLQTSNLIWATKLCCERIRLILLERLVFLPGKAILKALLTLTSAQFLVKRQTIFQKRLPPCASCCHW